MRIEVLLLFLRFKCTWTRFSLYVNKNQVNYLQKAFHINKVSKDLLSELQYYN